jgi:hypothetical protein
MPSWGDGGRGLWDLLIYFVMIILKKTDLLKLLLFFEVKSNLS